MASTPVLLYEVSLFQKSDQDFTLGRQQMQNAYLFEMLNI